MKNKRISLGKNSYIIFPCKIWLVMLITAKYNIFSFSRHQALQYILFSIGILFIISYIFFKVYNCQLKEYKGLLKRLRREIHEVMSGKRIKIFFRQQNNIDISSIKTRIEKPLDTSLRMEKAFKQWNHIINQKDSQLELKHLKKAEKAIKGIIINENLCRFF